ncbi:uncharacterized protein F5891DRAFT_1184364 [Suillus fuscotomentosus]|uniref:SBP-type domain-containing protein n=1 Tax=Suillus fuscotomentosus TaxID=1912939 RepID=A0AAD4EDC1_9AGAM|nr:uncharacterized protein F5891DRAFT_1184364 [Suillus fuscotomentosus]KAG1904180.1 hypothetical protein F5891DRAFT_1184364 [Suillus fuscotomentosus]
MSASLPTGASPPNIGSLFDSVLHHPLLADLPFNSFTSFLCRTKILKEDILQPQPHHVSIFCAPPFLPASVTGFLAASLDMPPETVKVLWSLVKDIMWELPSSAEASADDETAFRIYGHELGLTKHTLYPPIKICANHECAAWQCRSLLKKEEPHHIVLFTHSEGAKPGWTIHLKCRECNTNYQANYSVADHQFIELQLAMHWMDLMQIAVLATNCANLYTIAQTCHDLGDSDDHWQFGNALTTEQVWDCFTLLALLDDHQRRNKSLIVPHDGDQKNCFTGAMYACNTRIVHQGQNELPHACLGCMHIFKSPDGGLHRTEVIVTNGVTVGHPCCAIPWCKNPLDNNQLRFCAEHHHLEAVCAVNSCGQLVVVDIETGRKCKACDDPVHLHMEAVNIDSSCHGKSKTQHQKLSKLNNAITVHLP